MKIKALLTALLASTLVCSVVPVFAADPAPAEKPPIPTVGDAFQNFTAMNADGKSVTFDGDIKGKAKYTAVIFMNTACSACGMEARIMDGMAKENKDLKVYAMLVDARGEKALEMYKEKNPYPNTSFLLDKDFTIPPVYGYTYTPAMVVVDKGGKIIMSKGGFLASQGEQFTTEMKNLLK